MTKDCRSKQVLCFLLCLAGLLAGCVRTAQQQAPREEQPETKLTVENRNGFTTTIYVLRESQRVRLGQVSGHGTATFVIPGYLIAGIGALRFLADPVGSGRRPVSQEILVEPGDTVEMIIPPF